MAGPVFHADPVEAVALDGLTLLYHGPSGMTHIVAPPAPQILDALAQGPADAAELLRRLSARFDFEPSPLMGEMSGSPCPPDMASDRGAIRTRSWVGVESMESGAFPETPPHPQPLRIKGRGVELEALHARLDELEAAGLVRRA